MAPLRRIIHALKDNYPEIYKEIIGSFKDITRSFDDIHLLINVCKADNYDNRLLFMGCVVLMYTDSSLTKSHRLKRGTGVKVADVLGLKASNVSEYLSEAKVLMKYHSDLKAASSLMVQILDNYKSQLSHD